MGIKGRRGEVNESAKGSGTFLLLVVYRRGGGDIKNGTIAELHLRRGT